MKCSDDLKETCKSSAGIMAVSILVILVLFAVFTSSEKGGKLSKTSAAKMEDIREQQMEMQENQMEQQRNFNVKDGQNLVVF